MVDKLPTSAPSKSHLRLKILFYMAYRNLTNKKLRSSLTLIGVIIGTGAIFLLLSFGLGLQKLVQDQFTGSASIKTVDVSTPNSRILKLDPPNVARFEGINHVTSVGRSYSLAGKVSFNNSNVDSVVFASDLTFRTLSDLKLVKGALPADGQYKQALVNTSLLDAVGIHDYQKAVGQSVNLDINLPGSDKQLNLPISIVGVVQVGSGSEVLLPAKLVDEAGVDQYSQVKLVVDSKGDIAGVRSAVESMGFSTQSPVDTLNQINQVFYFFNFVLAAFGSVGMIIAVLGMFNTLTVSLLERTKEIGLLIALGARKKDMKRMFQSEALVLSIAGGILGILGAMLFGLVIDLVLNALAHGRGVTAGFSLFADPLWLMAGMIIFIGLVGMVVVYIPARRAAKINPIDALRYE